MSFKYYDLDALGSINDLIRTDDTPEYPLGSIVTIENDTKRNSEVLLEFIYIKNTNLTPMIAFEPVIIEESHIRDAEIFGDQRPKEQTKTIILIGIPQINISLNKYGFAQIKGEASCQVSGGIGSNNRLKYAVATPTVLKSTLVNIQAVGLTIGTVSSGTETINILLFGNRVSVPPT